MNGFIKVFLSQCFVLVLAGCAGKPVHETRDSYVRPSGETGQQCVQLAQKKKQKCDRAHQEDYNACVAEAKKDAQFPYDQEKAVYDEAAEKYELCKERADADARKLREKTKWEISQLEAKGNYLQAGVLRDNLQREISAYSAGCSHPGNQPKFNDFVNLSGCPRNTCKSEYHSDYKRCGGGVRSKRVCIKNCPETTIADVPAPLVIGRGDGHPAASLPNPLPGTILHFESSHSGPRSFLVVDVDERYVTLESESGSGYIKFRDVLTPWAVRTRKADSKIWSEAFTYDSADSWFPMKVGNKMTVRMHRKKRGRTANCEVSSYDKILIAAGKLDAFKIICKVISEETGKERFWLMYYSPLHSSYVYRSSGAIEGGFHVFELTGFERPQSFSGVKTRPILPPSTADIKYHEIGYMQKTQEAQQEVRMIQEPKGESQSAYRQGGRFESSDKTIWKHPEKEIRDRGCLSEGGCFHGVGEYRYSDGGTYEGEFLDGRKHGQGRYSYPTGSVYEGDWVKNKRHGKGVMVYANGEIYEGDWAQGKRQGAGAYRWNSGKTYMGEWENGIQQGYGKMVYPDGRVYEGRWEEGAPIE